MTLAVRGVALAGRLTDVAATLGTGTITAICGPNGAGKSTLLGVLAGLLDADDGEVLLGDRSLAGLRPRDRARAVGYLPQSGEVAWDVSVASLVALGRLPHGDGDSTGGRAAIAHAFAACDLQGFAGRPVSTLSGGEKARALLARVLAGEPQWILADEPLAALDLAHQASLLRVLRAEARAGRGVAVVVHDLAVAMNHADRVLVLDRGVLVADDAPAAALAEGVIARVWGVDAQWVGEPGAHALVVRP
ncbi:ATP-binding cassette domain-containing protein [Erythrobacter arachoides]|uniref:ATP-binding cassette domain-containing protein n=1 Tax=Aurantiacibacter arachoides TaxID=1850444 RepID=A0A844ZZ85_9SPHN|nr:ABC transporter ATP-binding protein [Aurantiacibacter arachoides]MXO92764.1 ATP-binding cassette domain-containing protein [Aurantiacibacter arachoides]GGD54669.1 ABC transporter [Aurantiacibacter arachoides]